MKRIVRLRGKRRVATRVMRLCRGLTACIFVGGLAQYCTNAQRVAAPTAVPSPVITQVTASTENLSFLQRWRGSVASTYLFIVLAVFLTVLPRARGIHSLHIANQNHHKKQLFAPKGFQQNRGAIKTRRGSAGRRSLWSMADKSPFTSHGTVATATPEFLPQQYEETAIRSSPFIRSSAQAHVLAIRAQILAQYEEARAEHLSFVRQRDSNDNMPSDSINTVAVRNRGMYKTATNARHHKGEFSHIAKNPVFKFDTPDTDRARQFHVKITRNPGQRWGLRLEPHAGRFRLNGVEDSGAAAKWASHLLPMTELLVVNNRDTSALSTSQLMSILTDNRVVELDLVICRNDALGFGNADKHHVSTNRENHTDLKPVQRLWRSEQSL